MLKFIACIIALTAELQAAVLRVPTEYATIQGALDSLSESDTVLVSPGTYVEALYSFGQSYTLMGDVIPDSSLQNLPVIDPANLPHSDTLGCLTIAQGTPFVRIERMSFKNGRLMYPHDNSGGIRDGAQHLTVKRCLFDSTNLGIAKALTPREFVEIDSCIFVDNHDGCVLAEEHTVVSQNTSFSGSGFSLVTCGALSVISGCRFRAGTSSYALLIFDDSIRVEYCDFGGVAGDGSVFLELDHTSGIVRHNVFANGQFAQTALNVRQNCFGPLTITGNIFQQLVEIKPVVLDCDEPGDAIVKVDSNLFMQITNEGGKAIQIEPDVVAQLLANRFMFLSPPERNTIYSASPSVIARENIFIETGMAVRAFAPFDARFNYWGDSTGPYHPALNPGGLGDSVSNFVEFIPWYPDTSFLIESAQDPPQLPSEFSFSVFPNPFNSTATISLDVPTAFIASIELHNTLGQRVREIHRGPVFGHEEFYLNADNLPSGVYFVSVRDIVQHSVATSKKLLLLR